VSYPERVIRGVSYVSWDIGGFARRQLFMRPDSPPPSGSGVAAMGVMTQDLLRPSRVGSPGAQSVRRPRERLPLRSLQSMRAYAIHVVLGRADAQATKTRLVDTYIPPPQLSSLPISVRASDLRDSKTHPRWGGCPLDALQVKFLRGQGGRGCTWERVWRAPLKRASPIPIPSGIGTNRHRGVFVEDPGALPRAPTDASTTLATRG
jgi:hypothetical protein